MGDVGEAGRSQILVVLDTNAWLGSNLLTSNAARSLLETVEDKDGLLAIPQIVMMELQHRVPDYFDRVGRKAATALSQLGKHFPELAGVRIPDVDDIQRFLQEQLDGLEGMILTSELNMGHVMRALERVLAGSPPSGPSHQEFRDCLVWEAAADWAARCRTCLVTSDRGFYGRESKGNDLAEPLQEEITGQGLDLAVFAEIPSCLKHLADQPAAVDAVHMESQLITTLESTVVYLADSRDFKVVEAKVLDLEYVPTRAENMFYSWFGIEYTLTDQNPSEEAKRGGAGLLITGDCYYDSVEKSVQEIVVDTARYTWFDPMGIQHVVEEAVGSVE